MLNTGTVLSNPPIQEAVIDYRFSSHSKDLLSRINDYADSAKVRFPEKKDKVEFKVELQAGEEVEQPKRTKKLVGCLLKSEDGQRLVQASTGSFSSHVLPPYAKWDELYVLMQEEWGRFQEFVGPSDITRIGIRYINNIEFKFSSGAHIGKYLKIIPVLPTNLAQSLDNFFVQVTIPSEKDLKAIVTLSLNEVKDNSVNVLLDIDVFATGENAVAKVLQENLSSMRKFKNEIFFGSVTELALEKYL